MFFQKLYHNDCNKSTVAQAVNNKRNKIYQISVDVNCVLSCSMCCIHRFDGDCVENNLEAAIDKSKPWSRSIEDLHGGSTLPSPITGNGITRAGRQSTLRYDTHTDFRIGPLTIRQLYLVTL